METLVSNLPQTVLVALAIVVSVAYVIRTGRETLDVLTRKITPDTLLTELEHAAEVSHRLGELGYEEPRKIVDRYIKMVLSDRLSIEVSRAFNKVSRSTLGIFLDMVVRVIVYVQIGLQVGWYYWGSTDREFGFQAIFGVEFSTFEEIGFAFFGVIGFAVLANLFIKFRNWHLGQDLKKYVELPKGAVH